MAQTIGKHFGNGFAGSFARQADMVVDTHPLAGDTVSFGTTLVYDKTGGVRAFQTGDTAEHFVGVAVREVKSAASYQDQNTGAYQQGEPVSVCKRGCISTICHVGTPVPGGKVYIRVAANGAIPTGVIGGLEAEPDTTAGKNNIELPNCRWLGNMDANRVAELRILTVNN